MAESPKCEICLDLDRRHYDNKIRYTPSGPKALLRDVLQSAEEGCPGCGVLVEALRHHAPEQIQSPESYEVNMHQDGGPLILVVTFIFPPYTEPRSEDGDTNMMEGEDQEFQTRIELFSQNNEKCPWSLVPTMHDVSHPKSVSSPELLSRARQWIAGCEASHAACVSPLSFSLPKRLVQIQRSPRGKRDKFSLRLLETKPGDIDRYVCLSHSRCMDPIITTQRQNVDLHCAAIPWGSLPKTFQDAIEFVFELGIELIWIDCLCIIQDDDADRREEAANISAYYWNSYFTLGASSGADSSSGLLSWGAHDRTTIQIAATDERTSKRFYITARKPITHQLETVDNRKERLLSRRFLRFGPRELIWECRQMTDCQCGGVAQITEARFQSNAVSQ